MKEVKDVEVSEFPRMTYDEAMKMYGSDKPDIRFGMKFIEMNDVCQKNDFVVFDSSELVVGINVKGGSSFTRKQLDMLTDFVKNSSDWS